MTEREGAESSPVKKVIDAVGALLEPDAPDAAAEVAVSLPEQNAAVNREEGSASVLPFSAVSATEEALACPAEAAVPGSSVHGSSDGEAASDFPADTNGKRAAPEADAVFKDSTEAGPASIGSGPDLIATAEGKLGDSFATEGGAAPIPAANSCATISAAAEATVPPIGGECLPEALESGSEAGTSASAQTSDGEAGSRAKSGAGLVKGAVVLSVGGFLSKVIGAVYRIPLTNLMGAEAIGLYQLVFPFYILLLTLSTTGLPSALSRRVAEGRENGRRVLRSAMLLMLLVCGVFTVLAAAFSGQIAAFFGEERLGPAYVRIAPAVLAVGLISCYRGYYQGRMNMLPTAASQVIEQLVKAGLSLGLCYAFLPDVVRCFYGAITAITVSEYVSLLWLILYHGRHARAEQISPVKRAEAGRGTGFLWKQILAVSLPITLSALLMPIGQMIDSGMCVRILGRLRMNGTALFGLFSGVVMSVLSIPNVLCASVSSAALPSVTRAIERGEKGTDKIAFVFKLTFLCAMIACVYLIFFSRDLISGLYRLDAADLDISARLLQLGGLSVVGLALMQTCVSLLIAQRHYYLPVVTLSVGLVVKVALNFFLLSSPQFHIFGAAISSAACYFVAGFLNLVYIIKENRSSFRVVRSALMPLALSLAAVLPVRYLTDALGLAGLPAVGLSVAAAGALYAGLVLLLPLFTHEEKQGIFGIFRRKRTANPDGTL